MSGSQVGINPLSVLPAGWQADRDVLVLVGQDHGGVAALFHAHGQQRIVSYLPQDAPEPASTVAAVVRDEEGLKKYVSNLSGNGPQLASVNGITGANVDPELVNRLSDLIGKALRAWHMGRNTVDESGALWLTQMVQNMERVASHPSVDELTGAFEGRPCIIVSPGPSLDKNVALLKELEGRALIMTCPHGLNALDEIGVVPDVVVIGDARVLAWQYGDYDFSRVPALVLMATSSPELFDLPAKQIFTYGFHPEIDLWVYEFLGKDAFLATGGSVACAEFSLAHRMGCSQIAFIGQDLAFDGGRYYASSARDGESVASLSEDGEHFVLNRQLPVDDFNRWGESTVPAPSRRVVEVPGYHGGTVQTSEALSVFIDWFTTVVTSDARTAKVYNCTEGGAYLEGMDHTPLSEFLGSLSEEEPVAHADDISSCKDRWDRAGAASLMTTHLAQVMAQMDACRSAAASCLKLARAARGNESRLRRLSKEENRLRREIKKVPFLAVMAQREIRQAAAAGAAAADVQSSLDASERLFQVVLKAVKAVHAHLSDSYRALRAA